MPAHSLPSPQFDSIEKSVDAEMSANMALIKQMIIAARRRKGRNGRLVGMVRGTWLVCARRCGLLLEVREQLRSRANQFRMADKKKSKERENDRECLIL